MNLQKRLEGYDVLDQSVGERIVQFMDYAGLTNFEIEDDLEEFDKTNYRYLDFIEAYGNCPIKAGLAYSKALRIASVARNIAFLGEIEIGVAPVEAELIAHEQFTKVMTSEFFQKFIQLRWRRFKEFKKNTGKTSPQLYSEYLEALLVISYLEYQTAGEYLGFLKP